MSLLPASATAGSSDGGWVPARSSFQIRCARSVAVRAPSLLDAVARADVHRHVWKAGRLVAHTTVARSFPGLGTPPAP